MGFAANLFDESDDEDAFWTAWNSMRRQERQIFRKRLGIETTRVLKKGGEVSATAARQELAKWVKDHVLPKPARRGDRGRRGRGRRR
jgi:hypothetical protein